MLAATIILLGFYFLGIAGFCLAMHNLPVPTLPNNPMPKHEPTFAERYDADYVALSDAIGKAQNHYQLRMARAAVQNFKDRYKKEKHSAPLNFDVNHLIQQCEWQAEAINYIPTVSN